MKMICPHCGLGGTAGDENYLKIVRCPDCQMLFRVTEAVAVDPVPHQPAVILPPEVEDSEVDVEEKREDSQGVEEFDSTLEDSGLKECAVCGFSFSSDFIRVVDGQQICPVCAN